MTGGWAATNTLRDIYDAVSPYAPGCSRCTVPADSEEWLGGRP